MNRLSLEQQTLIAASLVEGGSIRGTGRLANVTLNTVLRNQLWLGDACQRLHDEQVCELRCRRIEADELVFLIRGREKNLKPELQKHRDFGQMYAWIAIDPDTRLVISWHIGKREYRDAQTFAQDLASRITSRVQITTDQLAIYNPALEEAFGDRADYATVKKTLGLPVIMPDGKIERPDKLIGERRVSVFGNPDPSLIRTTSVENQHLHLRMRNKRYARSSNAISKKIEGARASLALYYAHHNFCHISPAIRVTPAMEAGITDHVWEIEELARLAGHSTPPNLKTGGSEES